MEEDGEETEEEEEDSHPGLLCWLWVTWPL